MSDRPHIIVDGYNLILRTKLVSTKDENALWAARDALLAQLEAYRSDKEIRITVVFDGQAVKLFNQPIKSGGIELLFSKAPQKADALIKNMIDRERQRRNITLVTSDRALADYARASGCETRSVEEFSRRWTRPKQESEHGAKYGKPLSTGEVDEWLRLFGLGKEER